MRLLDSRREKRGTHGEPNSGRMMIMEPPGHEPYTEDSVNKPAEAIPVVADRLGVFAASSQSDVSGVHPHQIRAYEASPTPSQTLSIHMNRAHYPKPPIASGGSDVFACKCRHIDRDLKPYVCLSETCTEGHPTFSTSDEWFRHMELHGHRWQRQNYLLTAWICTICDFKSNIYRNSEALHVHLKQSHADEFTSKQLQAFSRQSRIAQPRARNECLLCCCLVEETPQDHGGVVFPKRRKGSSKQQTAKNARKTHETITAVRPSPQANFSDTSSDSDDANPPSHRPQTQVHARALARHIAAHLQGLMLLTLRFAALQTDDAVLDDDAKSDLVDTDDGASASKGMDIGILSDFDSVADVSTEVLRGDEILRFDPDLVGDDRTLSQSQTAISVSRKSRDHVMASQPKMIFSYSESGSQGPFSRERGNHLQYSNSSHNEYVPA
ncbi:hypothetical protein N7539_008717 [Penicillium diatomitis]|uniref:C2H2-type domain-containing protein n=1 Tax=Penicillium diatomitis TaxID=2819901 RepID=A0A9X0BM71_9EURO|nr:uncharacterized protein N7539_008621 [Penicillium diatomitis]XP_056786694.1 uncharacterized protein N7539_008717 [Penicillium diatomitis]KAJ5472052.1 hypothetical protein N7539_008621 [Penicillium diatomitis]KAJ5472148.1 hypothetical protein N7539_008717 [Penicillium diatomitis]